jgi:adenylate cyclase
MAVGSETGVSAREVRDELSRVLCSAALGASERHRRFLAYVVDETLAGRADRIKAYTIATAAFGRGDDFDPQQESIVRIEAGRLRRALEHYYLTEGAGDRLRIVIPKGSYVPQFEQVAPGGQSPFAQATPAPRVPACIQGRGPRVFVAPLDQEGAGGGFESFASGFTRQLIMGLTRFDSVFVYGRATTDSQPAQPDLRQLAATLGVDFVLSGEVVFDAGRLTIDLLLQEMPTGRFVWTERFRRDLLPEALLQLRAEIADKVVQKLAQPYGILHSRALDSEGASPRRLGSYRAVLDYYDYIRTYDRERFAGIRAELEQAVADDPGYAEAAACLSMLYTAGVRFGHVTAGKAPGLREQAMGQALESVRMAPGSSSAHLALALAQWFSGHVDESLESYRTALDLNPNDSDLMADMSVRLAMRMEWDPAIRLFSEALRRNPFQSPTYRVASFLYHYAAGNHAAARVEAQKSGLPEIVHSHLMRAAAAAELGLRDEARAAVAGIERVWPDYGRHMADDLRSRNLHEDLIAALAQSVRKAGLRGVTLGAAQATQPPLRA